MRTLLAFVAVAALAACTTSNAASGNGAQIEWKCDGGAAFSMHLTSDGNAEVFAGGQTYALPAVQSGSGTRYTNGNVEYWEHGSEAMLNGAAGGPYHNCRR